MSFMEQLVMQTEELLVQVSPALRDFVETTILPRYNKFFSHGPEHIRRVIIDSLMLATHYHKDLDLTYAAAAYHDLGLKIDRAHHEAVSGEVVADDQDLPNFFSVAEIQVIREAVEDHRGSRKIPPRSFYGRIISDADRDFDLSTLARRQLATSFKNNPDLDSFAEHFERCYEYMSRRITDSGHFNLWTNHPVLLQRREQYEREFLDREYCRSVYAAAYDAMQRDGTVEKILTYYEDF